jgi:hypothetical protein
MANRILKSPADDTFGMGHNTGAERAKQVTSQLEVDYASLVEEAHKLQVGLHALPGKVTNKDDLGNISKTIVDMRNVMVRAEAYRKAEKEPYWESGKAVDGFFGSMVDALDKATTDLNARIRVFQDEQIAAERKRRRDEEEKARAAAEEARAAAERARKPSNILKHEETAAALDIEANRMAAQQHQKAADLTRTRFGDKNVLVTTREQGYARVIDYGKLNLDILRPYIPQAALEQAVKTYARQHQFKASLAGAEIGMENVPVVR